MSKSESYIILKPIAERLNRITSEITDDEIHHLIREELRSQLPTINFSYRVQELVDEYIDNNGSEILKLVQLSIQNKLL